MIRGRETTIWKDSRYDEIIECVELYMVNKIMTDHEADCYIGQFANTNDILYCDVARDNSRVTLVRIDLSRSKQPKMEIEFRNKDFQPHGLKGNLKREGFKYQSSRSYYIHYVIELNEDVNTMTKQVYRLINGLFKKYI